MKIGKNGLVLTPVFLGLVLALSGCLKTRAQLKEDPEQQAAVGVPGEVQSVEPSGASYAIDEIKGELTRLNGRLEDLERNQSEDSEDQVSAEEIRKLEEKIIRLEQTQLEILSQLNKLKTARTDPLTIFRNGKNQFKKGRYERAVEALSNYLETEKPRKAEEATYLRGESYFNLKKYNKAIIDFSKFPENTFPRSNYLPKALYKIALSFEAKGMKSDATAFYQELAESYPRTSEGKAAKKALAKLKRRKKN